MIYELDFATWRSGGMLDDAYYRHGDGTTRLLNNEGFACCLGQAAMQMGVSPENVLGIGKNCEPRDLADWLKKSGKDGWYDPLMLKPDAGDLRNTPFASLCMNVNDDLDMTPIERALELRRLFEHEGHELHFKNVHLAGLSL